MGLVIEDPLSLFRLVTDRNRVHNEEKPGAGMIENGYSGKEK